MSFEFGLGLQERQGNDIFFPPIRFRQINKNFCKIPFECRDIFSPRTMREMKQYHLTCQTTFIKYKDTVVKNQ